MDEHMRDPMDTTTLLKLPYIFANQAQKHITHNEALRRLDALVQLSVTSRSHASPPETANQGARYLIALNASGLWQNHAMDIAAYQDGAWTFFSPMPGWMCFIEDEDCTLLFSGTAWRYIEERKRFDMIGINTDANTTNRLAIASKVSFFSHDGDNHQIKLNKASTSDTGSIIFQNDWSGRAEFGLTGDDDFHVKISADGNNWMEAMVIDRTNGAVRFPSSNMRPILTENRTYYVSTNGDDGNDGLTSATTLTTLQKAIDIAMTLDTYGHDVTIQIADGTYEENIAIHAPLMGNGRLHIRGNRASPHLVIIGKSNQHAFYCTNKTSIFIEGIKMKASGSYKSAIHAIHSNITIGTVEFAAAARSHIECELGSVITILADYTISGGAERHMTLATNSTLTVANRTITLTGTPTFSHFVVAETGATASLWNTTFSGPATGQRHYIATNAAINSFGGGANYFPGNNAGSVANGGQFA